MSAQCGVTWGGVNFCQTIPYQARRSLLSIFNVGELIVLLYPKLDETFNNIRCGVMANIAVSHTAARGSIPRIGSISFFNLFFATKFLLLIYLQR